MRLRSRFLLSAMVLALFIVRLSAHAQSTPEVPRYVKQDGHAARMLDGEPYFVLGAQIHNSSSWEASLPKVWTLAEGLHVQCNRGSNLLGTDGTASAIQLWTCSSSKRGNITCT
jgi:hypothetical protein